MLHLNGGSSRFVYLLEPTERQGSNCNSLIIRALYGPGCATFDFLPNIIYAKCPFSYMSKKAPNPNFYEISLFNLLTDNNLLRAHTRRAHGSIWLHTA